MASTLKERMNQESLFKTNDSKIRNYVKSTMGEYKVHDFRTWNATQLAIRTIGNMKAPSNEKEYKAAVNHVGNIVGLKLGDKAGVVLKSYIDPKVFHGWKKL